MHLLGRLFVLLGTLSFLGGAAPLHAQTPERFQYRQTRMGMPVRVVLYAPDDSTARYAGRAAFRKMADLESILSSYRGSSALNRLSRRSGSGPVGP